MKSDPDKNYRDFKERFRVMSDEELVEVYKEDLKKPGWVRSRGEFLAALREEFEKRGLEYPPK